MPRRRGGGEALNPWPGYVDALSTLLMVIIFVLLVFVLAQAFLSVTLSGRTEDLARLNRQADELSGLLMAEREHSADLDDRLGATSAARDALTAALQDARAAQARALAERDQTRQARDALTTRVSQIQAAVEAADARDAALRAQLSGAGLRADQTAQALATATAALTAARRDLDAMTRAKAELDQTVTADRATVAARLSDLAAAATELDRTRALLDAMRRERDALDTTVQTDRATIAARLSDLARQTQQSDAAEAALRQKLSDVEHALEVSEGSAAAKDATIVGLNDRLNTALAQKVEELQRYRSDFFGRLRTVLANRPGITVVGDRFVFQSEVLFPVGSADLSAAGRDQLATLARTLVDLAKNIPADVPWVLRVDGHADRQPLDPNSPFADNLGLSAQRAINVVKLLAADGVPANRLAATAFGDTQPLDAAATQDAYARNRRIEIRLTDR